MANYVGQLASIGTAVESVWGTAVAPVLFVAEANDFDMNPRIGMEHPDQIAGMLAQRRRRIGISTINGGGSFDVSAGGILAHLLWSVFGSKGMTQVITGSVYKHTFSFDEDAVASVTPPSLTVEVNRGAYNYRYRGCCVDRLALSMAQGEANVLTARADLVGKDDVATTASSASYNIDDALGYGGWHCTLDTATTTVTDMDVEFSRNIQPLLSSASSGTPSALTSDRLAIQGSYRRLVADSLHLGAYKAQATKALAFTFRGTAVFSNEAYYVKLNFPLVDLTEYALPVAPGLLYERVSWRARYDTSSGLAWVDVQNATSGY